jgi:hypothetical protein
MGKRPLSRKGKGYWYCIILALLSLAKDSKLSSVINDRTKPEPYSCSSLWQLWPCCLQTGALWKVDWVQVESMRPGLFILD